MVLKSVCSSHENSYLCYLLASTKTVPPTPPPAQCSEFGPAFFWRWMTLDIFHAISTFSGSGGLLVLPNAIQKWRRTWHQRPLLLFPLYSVPFVPCSPGHNHRSGDDTPFPWVFSILISMYTYKTVLGNVVCVLKPPPNSSILYLYFCSVPRLTPPFWGLSTLIRVDLVGFTDLKALYNVRPLPVSLPAGALIFILR